MGKSKKIGLVCGTWDFVHKGHVKLFEECKKICDYLIVGLQTDPTKSKILVKGFEKRKKKKPVMSLEERYYMLRANKFVDAILVYETEQELMSLEKWFPTNFRFSGIENLNKKHYPTKGKFVYIEGDNSIHSSDIRKRCQEH